MARARVVYDAAMQIYVGREGDQRGPYSLEQIQQYLAQGGLQPTDSAWYEGLDRWIPLSEVPGVVGAPPEAPVAPRKKKTPQRRRNEEIDQRPRKKLSRVVVSVVSLLVVTGIVLVWKWDRIRVWYLSMSDHGLVGANLWHADLPGVNLEGANLADAILTGADLSGANLREAILRRADLRYTNLQGANLEGANLKFTNLRGASLKFANLKGASLWGTVLQDTDLRSANLEGATIRALLIDTNLTGANLEGANLSGAFGVILEGTTGTPLPTKIPKLGEYIKEAFELELEE